MKTLVIGLVALALFAGIGQAQTETTCQAAGFGRYNCTTEQAQKNRWEMISDGLQNIADLPRLRREREAQGRLDDLEIQRRQLEVERGRLENEAEERRLDARDAAEAQWTEKNKSFYVIRDSLVNAGHDRLEACISATLEAYGAIPQDANRYCLQRLTGAKSYNEFVGIMVNNGITASKACWFAEVLWNDAISDEADATCATRK